MSNTKDILQLLEKEIDKLSNQHMEEVVLLKKENERLQYEKQQLEIHNNKLQQQIAVLKFVTPSPLNQEVLLNHIKQLSILISYDFLDELFMSSIKEDSYLLLLHLNNFLNNNDIEKVHYLLDLINSHGEPILINDQLTQDLLYSFFNTINDANNYDFEYLDAFLGDLILLMTNLYKTTLKTLINNYIKHNYIMLLENALYLNEPKIIINLLKLFKKYQLEAELKEMIMHIIDKEWAFLDFNVTKTQFYFFLWYSFLYDLDQRFINSTQESIKWLKDQNNLYSFIYDCFNNKQSFNTKKLEQSKKQLQTISLLNSDEMKLIFKKIDDLFPQLIESDISSNKIEQAQPLSTFKWPSTEVQEKDTTQNSKDQSLLKENSDLNMLGYKITGLTKEKRWDILKDAVPKLGLKSVAYIIANNIRLRKSQKNGLQKYNYAINEWEHDLNKLKMTYYNKEFTWPNY